MINCPVCKNKLKLTRLDCGGCGLKMEGAFSLPRLARLPPEQMNLAEQMILCGGNLKDLSEIVGVSYPTLRRKVDELILILKEIGQQDADLVTKILEDMEKGTIKSEEGIRMIREVQGEI